jgi:hypothetical protein
MEHNRIPTHHSWGLESSARMCYDPPTNAQLANRPSDIYDNNAALVLSPGRKACPAGRHSIHLRQAPRRRIVAWASFCAKNPAQNNARHRRKVSFHRSLEEAEQPM